MNRPKSAAGLSAVTRVASTATARLPASADTSIKDRRIKVLLHWAPPIEAAKIDDEGPVLPACDAQVKSPQQIRRAAVPENAIQRVLIPPCSIPTDSPLY